MGAGGGWGLGPGRVPWFGKAGAGAGAQFITNLGRRLRPGPPAPLRRGQAGRCYWPIQRPHWLVCSHESACRMHAVAGGGEHGAGGGIGRKRRIGWPSIVSLGLEVSNLFGSQRSPHCLPTTSALPRPAPVTSLWGKGDFAKLASPKWVGPPGVCGQGPCGLGSVGLVAKFLNRFFTNPRRLG
jgi:hypothetical protein